jgi:hypothetical protein
MPCNWKFAADNFAGDGYHIPTSHISAIKSGATGNRNIQNILNVERYGVDVGNGHATNIFPGRDAAAAGNELLSNYLDEIHPDKTSRLGDVRSKLPLGVATVFPNLSFHGSPSIRIWHPRGPHKTEVWSWCIVDKNAPAEVKDAMRRNYQMTFGMSGTFEMDDGENWKECTASSNGVISRRYPFSYAMGLGHERLHEDYPGLLGPQITEANMRGLYRRWAEMMAAESWSDLGTTRKDV